MASRIPDTNESHRRFWASFPHDKDGNVIIKDLARNEDLPGTADSEIQAIIDALERDTGEEVAPT